MPRPIHRLSDKQCKHAKPGKLGDGGGLLLRTTAQGSSRWAFQYARDGKTREMGLGGYAAVSLAKARSIAEKQRKVLAAGKDLFRERDLAKMRLKKERTFTSVAAEYIRVQRHGWKNRKHARQWCSTLKRNARPVIGELAVKDITQNDVLVVLKAIWLEKPETAKRVQGRIENIIDYATVTGYRSGDNPARWRGYLDKALLPRSKVRAVRHHPALPYSDIPAFWSDLVDQTRPGAPMLRFLILTAMRTSLQFIKPDGTKRFVKGGKVAGGFFMIGEVAETLLLCEGFATGATLREETGHAVCCAFHAGNLVEVARRLRTRHPNAEIIVCGDNDHATSGNPGKTMAQKAATAVGGKWVVPDFTGRNAGPKDTDFNDLTRLNAKAGAAWA